VESEPEESEPEESVGAEELTGLSLLVTMDADAAGHGPRSVEDQHIVSTNVGSRGLMHGSPTPDFSMELSGWFVGCGFWVVGVWVVGFGLRGLGGRTRGA
jgi:hypothetical protein